jgi:hypothetical protein
VRGSLHCCFVVLKMFHLSRKILYMGLINCILVKWGLIPICIGRVLMKIGFFMRFEAKDCLIHRLHPSLIFGARLVLLLSKKFRRCWLMLQ